MDNEKIPKTVSTFQRYCFEEQSQLRAQAKEPKSEALKVKSSVCTYLEKVQAIFIDEISGAPISETETSSELRQEEQDELDEVLLQLKQIFSGGRNNNTNVKENSSTSPKKDATIVPRFCIEESRFRPVDTDFVSGEPRFCLTQPRFCSVTSDFVPNEPGFGPMKSDFVPSKPDFVLSDPEFSQIKSDLLLREPGFDSIKSDFVSGETGFGPIKSEICSNKSKFPPVKPGVCSIVPRFPPIVETTFHFDASSASSKQSRVSADEMIIMSEEIVHTDSESDVKMFEKRYPSFSKSVCSDESVDIFVDLSLNESGISEMRIRQAEDDSALVQGHCKDAQTFCDITVEDVTETKITDSTLDEMMYYDVSATEDYFSSSLPSCTSMNSMKSVEIRKELLLFGQNDIGPIIPSTRRTYLVRLKKLRQGRIESPKNCVGNFAEGTLQKLNSMMKLDDEMSTKFGDLNLETKSAINLRTRDGITKSSFNYLLLDPGLTQNLPLNYSEKSEQESLNIFLSSVFYIGKGTRSRPFHHLYEAVKKYDRNVGNRSGKLDRKTRRILDIWQSGSGVVCLQVFQNSIGDEALTREAAMIDAIGLTQLTNEIRGHYHGVASSWSSEKRLSLGFALLYRCFKIFLFEGERQLRPLDLKICRK